MPVTVNGGPGQQVTVNGLKDLESGSPTIFNLGKELATYFDHPLSDVPDNAKTNVQYDSGNQNWKVNAVAFNLSGGVTGRIGVIKSGKLYDYTDSFPTVVELDLSPKKNSDSTTPFQVEAGSIYVMVELDFSIKAGVNITSAATSFGLTGSVSASTSDSLQVAFYKKCAPTDILSDAVGRAFKDLVLPFHAKTLDNLQPCDILRHTANANLQLGLGAGIGFGKFSLADQWKSGIPGLQNSPTLSLGIKPTVQTGVNLAYCFGYAGMFEQTLWRESVTSARLHLYKSKEKSQSLDLTAGITADANASATTAVQGQILKAPQNATTDPRVTAALQTAFQAASGEVSKLSDEINSKVTNLLKPVNKALEINLDVKISSTNQTFLLTEYTIDLTKNYGAAWSDMSNGKFVDALADPSGSVQLAVGSGLEKLYNRTASISLNFFGQAAAQWSESAISNSSLIYAGNNTFHLLTVDGMQRLSKISASTTEVDFYFSAEIDLSDAAAAKLLPPDLNATLRARNNGGFGSRIATVVGFLTSGPGSQDLQNQILNLANTPSTTQVLHIVFRPSAYQNLGFSLAGALPPDDATDRKNFAAFASACATTMPDGTASQFTYGGHPLTYDLWSSWNIALTDQWPPAAGAKPNRKGTGSFQGGYVQSFLDSHFGPNSPAFTIGTPLQAGSEFMDLCEDLNHLSTAKVDITTWDDFAHRLLAIAKRDLNLDFTVPVVLALTKICANAIPTQTVGPAPGLSGDTSIGVTMTFS